MCWSSSWWEQRAGHFASRRKRMLQMYLQTGQRTNPVGVSAATDPAASVCWRCSPAGCLAPSPTPRLPSARLLHGPDRCCRLGDWLMSGLAPSPPRLLLSPSSSLMLVASGSLLPSWLLPSRTNTCPVRRRVAAGAPLPPPASTGACCSEARRFLTGCRLLSSCAPWAAPVWAAAATAARSSGRAAIQAAVSCNIP